MNFVVKLWAKFCYQQRQHVGVTCPPLLCMARWHGRGFCPSLAVSSSQHISGLLGPSPWLARLSLRQLPHCIEAAILSGHPQPCEKWLCPIPSAPCPGPSLSELEMCWGGRCSRKGQNTPADNSGRESVAAAGRVQGMGLLGRMPGRFPLLSLS